MVRGIGVDMVELAEFERLCGELGGLPDEGSAFVRRTFTEAERMQASARPRPGEYLAGRFAVKEAVFKAVSGCVPEGFDLRRIESLDDERTGAPHVVMAGEFGRVAHAAGISEVLVSITNEGGYVVAVALAQ